MRVEGFAWASVGALDGSATESEAPGVSVLFVGVLRISDALHSGGWERFGVQEIEGLVLRSYSRGGGLVGQTRLPQISRMSFFWGGSL